MANSIQTYIDSFNWHQSLGMQSMELIYTDKALQLKYFSFLSKRQCLSFLPSCCAAFSFVYRRGQSTSDLSYQCLVVVAASAATSVVSSFGHITLSTGPLHHSLSASPSKLGDKQFERNLSFLRISVHLHAQFYFSKWKTVAKYFKSSGTYFDNLK